MSMKLAITLELDVDLVVWGDEYDVRGPDIKPDVARYVANLVMNSAAGEAEAIGAVVKVVSVVERKSR